MPSGTSGGRCTRASTLIRTNATVRRRASGKVQTVRDRAYFAKNMAAA